MIERLRAARQLLNNALDTYIDACSTIQNCCAWNTNTQDHRSELESLINYATDELLLFSTYEAKIKRAQAAMSVARNCSRTLAPINSLPPEILSRIFQLVLDSQNCIGKEVLAPPKSFGFEHTFPEYPDLLSCVCHRWRQIAIGSTTLWSHIDIAPQYSASQRLLVRAKAYAARASEPFLDIHVADPTSSYECDPTDVVEFLSAVAPRMRSLELVASNTSAWFHRSVLHCCFTHCTPGTFVQLHLWHRGYSFSHFIEPADNSDKSDGLFLGIPEEILERIWSPVVSLRLGGIYPHWTSRAYYGLTELHLFPLGKYNLAPISETQLVDILKASPKLRVFHFNLTITESLPKGSSIAPVQLDDFEVLNARLLPYDQLEILLRWVAPGSNPLQLSLEHPGPLGKLNQSPFGSSSTLLSAPKWSIFDLGDEVNRFLGRSEVSTLCLNGLPASLTHAIELLQLTRGLRVLVLQSFSGFRLTNPIAEPSHGHSVSKTIPQIDHLYMLKCGFNSDLVQVLAQVLATYSVQRLTLWDCHYFHDMHSRSDEDALESNLLSIFPATRFVSRHEPNPTAHWPVTHD